MMFKRFRERLRGFIYRTMKSAYLDAFEEMNKDMERRNILNLQALDALSDSIKRLPNEIGTSMRKAINDHLAYEHNTFNNPHFWNRINAAQEAGAFIRENNKNAVIFHDNLNLEVLKYALGLISIDGLVIECGVFKGRSINFIATHLPNKTIYGFDSFDGLPEEWTGWEGHLTGHFATPIPDVKDNVVLIKGWFDDTLPKFHNETPAQSLSLLHIDCDLYSSTVTILETLATRIVPGTVIAFDEYLNFVSWREHEAKAFSEFCEKYEVKFTFKAFGFFQAVIIIDEIATASYKHY